jgi:hypothetical protein
MADTLARLTRELDRVTGNPAKDSSPQGIGTVRFVIDCPKDVDAASVLERAKSVMAAVDSAVLQGWPSNDHAAPILPKWFTSACAPEKSKEEKAQWLRWWRGLSYEEKLRKGAEAKWSLSNWLYWLEPENRECFWWDSFIQEGSNRIVLAVEVDGSPFPWEHLGWLFLAAGAATVEEE